ncbi:hypothetical protein AB0C96_12985 [Streptomyces sp. NPDC048506]|uniref:hypothetical protein n=1 Tax=Streptomyces sp. NPDC048506 TaxID=3155028 RepID=UPI003416761C
MSADRPTLPPVRLHSEAELARDALSAPLMARAAKLARWAERGVPVGVGGEILQDALAAATEHLGLADDEDGPAYTAEAWQLAVDTGLVEIEESEGTATPGSAEDGAELPDDAAVGTATPGEELSLLTSGSPQDVLDIWLGGMETVLADAAAPDLADLADQLTEGGELDLDALDWNPEEEAELLDGILGNLYLLTALADRPDQDVPLPALAASMIVPDDMDEPTDDILEEVSDAMMRLDDQFRVLEPIGLVAYRPVDEALIEELDEQGETTLPQRPSAGSDPAEPLTDEDVSRYGLVRLTPLGVYAVRARLLDAGVHAPAVGDLADKGAEVLLDALPDYPEGLARIESEQWLAARTPLEAARDLLAAARGDDPGAPRRRLAAQQTLSLVAPEAEAGLREVLDDRQLGGLARVWLAERGLPGIPEPSQDMIFWLTVDTLAAQLDSADEDTEAELRDLVTGLTVQHSGFFDSVWRVDHPATADVLEAMGRLHPDKKSAKEARKAAFKARSRQG